MTTYTGKAPLALMHVADLGTPLPTDESTCLPVAYRDVGIVQVPTLFTDFGEDYTLPFTFMHRADRDRFVAPDGYRVVVLQAMHPETGKAIRVVLPKAQLYRDRVQASVESGVVAHLYLTAGGGRERLT